MKKVIFLSVIFLLCAALCSCSAAYENNKGTTAPAGVSGVADRDALIAKIGQTNYNYYKMELGRFEKSIPRLSAKDLKGNNLDSLFYTDAQLTVINFWGTYCPPCIEEFPELNELNTALSDTGKDVRLIGIVVDGNQKKDKAVSLESQYNLNFDSYVLENDVVNNAFLSQIMSIPTTLLINRKGELVTAVKVGMGTKDEYMTLIDLALLDVK